MSATLTRLVDRAMDLAVVPGYTSLGHAVRRRSWAADDPAAGSLAGRRAVVTGANSGLGKETVRGLARLGASCHLVVRSRERGEQAVAELRTDLAAEGVEAELVLEVCDVSDLTACRRLAHDLRGRLGALDVVVHNAGAMPSERTESVDGHEMSLALHVLGPVVLTEALLPLLRGGRVVVVSSGGMYAHRLPVEDPDFERGEYRGASAYARSKRVQVALGPLLEARWAAYGPTVAVMHPGWADTPGILTSLPAFHTMTGPLLRRPEQGADTVVWLAATTPARSGGRFWQDRAERPAHYLGIHRETSEDRHRMLGWVLGACGLPDLPPG